MRAVDAALHPSCASLVAIGGHYGLDPTAYAATAGVGNAALVNPSRQLSIAYGLGGVTLHVVAPGPGGHGAFCEPSRKVGPGGMA